MARKYMTEIVSLEENMDILKGELYLFRAKSLKKSGKKVRAVLMNIKKLCHTLRLQVLKEIKSMPKAKRYDSPESLESARKKRKATLARKRLEREKLN